MVVAQHHCTTSSYTGKQQLVEHKSSYTEQQLEYIQEFIH